MSLGVGAALGSTFFVASAVLPLVVICAKDAKEGVRVDATSFVRDGAFYLAAVVSVAGMLAGGSVSAAQATSAFFLYPVYLGAVLLPGRVRLLLRRLKSGLPGPTSPRADAADDDARTNAGSASRTFLSTATRRRPKSRRRAPRPRDTESLCSRVRSTQTTARTGSATPCTPCSTRRTPRRASWRRVGRGSRAWHRF